MLDYGKLILSKVSFDKKLFRKEYRKALAHLNESDAQSLRHWVRSFVSQPVNRVQAAPYHA